jgi:DNA helicase-2/ATP-dependent DNA helicase PcrA
MTRSKCKLITENTTAVKLTHFIVLLYCVTPRFRQNFGDYEASVRSRFLDNMDKSLYVTKTPEWDNNVRTMLATTIGKPIPPPDDSLSTKNKGLKAKQDEDGYSYSQPVYSDIRFGINGNKVDLFSLGGFSSAMTLVDSQLPSTQKFNSKKKTAAPASSQPIMSLFRMNKTTAPKRERLSSMIEDPPNNQKKAKKEENEDDALLACLKEEDDFF